jgi:murein DD-endopeptidase MepM/ murein hydrolase activator NlpD
MRWPLRLLAALALIVSVATPPLGAAAQQSDKQQQLQQQIQEAGQAEQTARDRLTQAQTESQRLSGALADVNARLAAANTRLAAAQQVVDALALQQVALQAQADETQQKLDAAQSDVRRSAVLLYHHGDGVSMIGLLGSTDGSGALVEGKHYLQRVSDKRQDDARRVARLKDQLDGQRAELARQKDTADAAQAAAADEKSQLDSLAAQQQRALAASNGAQQAAASARDSAIALQIQAEAALEQESARIAAIAQSAGDGPALGDGTFIRPVSGGFTSNYGYRTDPITGAQAFHAGIDFGAPCGTPIKAAGTGIVLTAGFNSGGYGNMTLINHGNGRSTLYGHQSSIIVTAGQSVSQGQVIGYVGTTGKSTGCHLHFEVRINGNPVNPVAYL